MSLEIINASVLAISLDTEANQLQIKNHNALPADDHSLNELIERSHTTYNAKPAKGYASFIESNQGGGEEKRFTEALDEYLEQTSPFADFSLLTANKLILAMAENEHVEEGLFIICHYRSLGREFLLLTYSSQTAALAFDQNLTLHQSTYLDLSKLQLAARLDLDALREQEDMPLSFIRGRVGRKVSDFFLEFLNAEEYREAKQQNERLVEAVETYCDTAQLNKEEKQQVRKETSQYYKEQQQAGERLNIAQLSEVVGAVSGDNHGLLNQVADELPEELPPVASVVGKVTKFSGQGRGVSIGFERGLLGDSVLFDPQNETLTITRVPPNLLDQLKRHVKSSGDE
ncbi:nucleoid-associated protein [Corallincola platygyrae]|uniref:Nucleoid-associated protein n=1 Tax=Corallincola platygyrae TaxID=1193278 RepID=A0ABW4XGD9_9GAMM